MARKPAPKWSLDIKTEANGRLKKSTIYVRGDGDELLFTDLSNLTSAVERGKASDRIAQQLKISSTKVRPALDAAWNDTVKQQEQRRNEVAAVPAVSEATVELCDAQPDEIRRPFSLIGGRAYAAAWCRTKISVTKSADPKTGQVTEHKPPLVRYEPRLLIVTGDGRLYADGDGVPGALPFAELGLPVRLAGTLPPAQGWSGAGVKRYVAGDRPNPAEAFARLVSVVDFFVDFARSLAPQRTMCEFVGCYVLVTYFLDAFNVVGYLWPNGEMGAGKTTLLHVVADTAYLGQLILAGSSYPTLRDMADYGATLAFDDAEAIMDVRRTDPDKRTLLLAGNRRGATIAVKELQKDIWVTRYVNTFCPRLFSAIRLPDNVLGSRTITVPLVRSVDEKRAKAIVADYSTWPCERRRLVDDLWAIGLANLNVLAGHDCEAVQLSALIGRNLEPWRAVLAVAHWLQERHHVEGLFHRMEELSREYQADRPDFEEDHSTQVLFRALLEKVVGQEPEQPVVLRPAEVAARMNEIASAEELTDADKEFTNARKVGWMLKRQRFHRPTGIGRDDQSKQWRVTRQEVESAAKAHGVEAPRSEVGSNG